VHRQCYALLKGARVDFEASAFAESLACGIYSPVTYVRSFPACAYSLPDSSCLRLPAYRRWLTVNPSFLKGDRWAGDLGFDPISQTIPLTVDFRAMQLSVEDR
jgi:hypothetical protein